MQLQLPDNSGTSIQVDSTPLMPRPSATAPVPSAPSEELFDQTAFWETVSPTNIFETARKVPFSAENTRLAFSLVIAVLYPLGVLPANEFKKILPMVIGLAILNATTYLRRLVHIKTFIEAYTKKEQLLNLPETVNEHAELDETLRSQRHYAGIIALVALALACGGCGIAGYEFASTTTPAVIKLLWLAAPGFCIGAAGSLFTYQANRHNKRVAPGGEISAAPGSWSVPLLLVTLSFTATVIAITLEKDHPGVAVFMLAACLVLLWHGINTLDHSISTSSRAILAAKESKEESPEGVTAPVTSTERSCGCFRSSIRKPTESFFLFATVLASFGGIGYLAGKSGGLVTTVALLSIDAIMSASAVGLHEEQVVKALTEPLTSQGINIDTPRVRRT